MSVITQPHRLDRALTYRLHQLHKLTDAQSARMYASCAKLTLSDARCLTAVGSFAPLSINDLALKANLNKAQASRAAQSLVTQGLVKKVSNAQDARAVVLTLTTRGRSTWQRAMAVVLQRNVDIFSVLNAAEKKILGQLLDRLIVHAQT